MTPVIEFATRLQSMGAIGAFILLIVKATVILVIARALLAALSNASAAARHVALTAAITAVLVLPLLMVLVPSWNVPLFPERGQEARSIGTTGDEDEAPTALEAALTVARATGVVPQERLTAMSAFFETVKNSWQGLLVLMIGVVSVVLLLRMVAGIVGVSRVARRAARITEDEALVELDAACDHLRIDSDVTLLRSAEISVPVVWGITRPVLLLPASSATWPAERLRVVILHELAHVKRWDGATLLLARASVALFWFHPLMWTIEKISRSECERACDDLVLQSGAKPSDYAEHLLSIARALPHTDPFRSVTLAMSRRSQLEGRLLSILQPRTRRGGFSMRTLSTYAAAALMIVVPLASVRLGAAPKDSPRPESREQREAIVEIGPAVAAKVMATPEMLLAGIEKLKHKRNSEPTDGADWYGHAYELHRADRHAEAIEAFKQSIALGHRVAASKYNIACGYALMEDEQNAIAWLQDAIASGWDDYGHIARDSDFDPIRNSPRFRQLVASLDGAARKQDRRIEETLDRFDALRTGSYDGDDWHSVGVDLLRLRKLDESIVAFENAIKLDGKTSTALYNMACALSLKGDTRAAADSLQRAVQNGFDNVEKLKNDPDLRNVRSEVNVAELIQMAEDLELHTGWKGVGSWFFFGGEEGAWKEKLPHYEAMTRKHPNLGRTWFNLGYAQLQAGENEASARSFQKALQLGYRAGASTYNTACAYARAGNNDRAFEWLQKTRAIGFKLHDYLEDDDDLDNLHDDPRWRQLRQQVRADEKKAERGGVLD